MRAHDLVAFDLEADVAEGRVVDECREGREKAVLRCEGAHRRLRKTPRHSSQPPTTETGQHAKIIRGELLKFYYDLD